MSIYTDYSYELNDAAQMGLGILGGIAIFGIITMILSIAISVIMLIALWKIFTKLGKNGWISLIPFYNTWVLFETQGIKGWLSLIPIANIIFMYIAYYKLAINFGKSAGFAICTIFFPYICLPILAFSKTNNDNLNTSQNNISQPNINNNHVLENQVNNFNTQSGNDTTMNSMNATVQPVISNKICPNCQSSNPEDSAFCSNCGTKI